jgi:hypothetical protein
MPALDFGGGGGGVDFVVATTSLISATNPGCYWWWKLKVSQRMPIIEHKFYIVKLGFTNQI